MALVKGQSMGARKEETVNTIEEAEDTREKATSGTREWRRRG